MINKLYLKRAEEGRSLTTTVFVYGSAVCLVKFLLSGLVIKGFAVPIFSGVDFGVAISAVGGIYVLNKKKQEKENNGQA